MWRLGEIAITIALGVGGAFVTLYSPPDSLKPYWLMGFVVATLAAGACAFVAGRQDATESSEKHKSLLAATTGGDNFAYIEPIRPGHPGIVMKEQLAILRPRNNSPIYDVSWSLARVGTGEVVARGQLQTLNGASHVIVSSDLPVGEYSAFISARNGEIYETITVTEINGGKHARIVVERGANPLKLPWVTLLERSH